MKKSLWNLCCVSVAASVLCFSETAYAANPRFTGNDIADGLISTIVYSVIGIMMAFVSYKVIDLVTPGDLSKDIAKDSVALAIVAGLTILGICIIIAAAIAG